MTYATFHKEQFNEEVLTLLDSGVELVIFNDDVNTFDHVIYCLQEICSHTPEQAEQCTLIIHYKGKCAVKKGALSELTPMHSALLDQGLSAIIQS